MVHVGDEGKWLRFAPALAAHDEVAEAVLGDRQAALRRELSHERGDAVLVEGSGGKGEDGTEDGKRHGVVE
jgi:hypothetical protein